MVNYVARCFTEKVLYILFTAAYYISINALVLTNYIQDALIPAVLVGIRELLCEISCV